MKCRRNHLAIVLAAGVLLVFYFGHDLARLTIHFAITQFCHGVSSGKVIFLLGWIIAVNLRLMLPRPMLTSAPRSVFALPFFVLIGLVGTFASCLLYLQAHDLPTDWTAFHWSGDVHSVNCMVHIHTSKAALATAIDALGLEAWHGRFDTGAAYLNAVPSWLATSIGISFMVAIGSALHAAAWFVGRFDDSERPFVSVAYALASAALCKSILDGGPFAYDVPAAAVTLWLVSKSRSLREMATVLRARWVVWMAALAVWVVAILIVDAAALPVQTENMVYRLALYATLLVGGYVATARPVTVRATAVLAIPVVVVFVVGSQRAAHTIAPLFEPAPGVAWRYPEPAAELQGNLALGLAERLELPHGATFFDAYRLAGEPALRTRRISIPSTDWSWSTGTYAELIVVAPRDGRVVLDPSPLIRFVRFDPVPTDAGPSDADRRPRFWVQIEFAAAAPAVCPPPGKHMTQLDSNERHVSFTLLRDYLRSAGVEEYILVPYAYYRGEPRPSRQEE